MMLPSLGRLLPVMKLVLLSVATARAARIDRKLRGDLGAAVNDTFFSGIELLQGSAPLAQILAESQEIKDIAARRRLQGLPPCYNFGEMFFVVPLLGQTSCGHMVASQGIELMCSFQYCPEMNAGGHGHMGGQLCAFAHACDALCGFCQMPAMPDPLLPSVPRTVDISASFSQMLANTPTYHSFDVVAGRTYRFTAWAEDETALKSVFLLLVDSTGYPIRRSMTQRGHVSHGEQLLDPTLDDILSTKRDTTDGCRGDTQASVVYKAEESATFQVGVGHTIGECPSASPFPLHSPCFAEVLLVPFCECSSASPCCVPELLVAEFCAVH